MSLSSSAILDWHHCNFPWYFDWRHFPPKVYGRGRFDLPHQQQDYVLRPRESICWISPCLISPAQRPLEDIKCILFGYLALNEQPLLARLRPAGGTERIVVIAESTKQFVLCLSFRPDFTLKRPFARNARHRKHSLLRWRKSLLITDSLIQDPSTLVRGEFYLVRSETESLLFLSELNIV